MKNIIKTIFLAFCISTSTISNGATIIAPGAAATTEGDEYNVYPFSLYPDGYYQQLYDASLFSGQSGVIDQIQFRLDGDAIGATFDSAHNIEVRLSHTSITPDTMSTTFSNNVGSDETIVFSDYIRFSSSYTSGVNPFDIVIDINNIFTYNGYDNLLLQIKHSRDTACIGCSPAWLDAVSSSFEGGSLMQRVWSNDLNATVGYSAEPRGLVTSFVINPVPVPAAIWLFISGALGLTYFARHKNLYDN